MALTVLPIALRELRVAARRRTVYRIRFGAAVVAVCMTAWFFLVSQSSPPAVLSREIFSGVASIFFGYALLIGSRVTADSLSEEKRDGTLGLLFLTDLKGHDVVAGKMVATSMNCVYGLLAVFPVLTLPLLLGGLPWALVWQVALILLNTLFFSLATGMFASSICRTERNAMGLAFLFLGLVAAGLPALGEGYVEYVRKTGGPTPALFTYPSPFIQFVHTMMSHSSGAFGPARGFTGLDYWSSMASIHALGWLFLLLACQAVPRSWQDVPDSPWRERWRQRWLFWCYGDSTDRGLLRRELLDVNPFLWICGGRDRLQSSLLWGLLGLLGVGFIYGAIKVRGEWMSSPTAVATTLLFGACLKYWLVGESTRRFRDIRRDGALELLVCTPLTVSEMLRGQYLAMRRLFGGPLLAILIVDFLMLAMALRDTADREDRAAFAVAFLAAITLLVADYHALIWVGTWQGLTAKSAKTASGNTAWQILVFPWILWGLSMPLVIFFWKAVFGYGHELSPTAAIVWWLAIGLFVDWACGFRAYRRLNADFRTIAAHGQPPSARWRSWPRFQRRRSGLIPHEQAPANPPAASR